MWAGGVRVIIQDIGGRVLLVSQRHEGKEIWMPPGGAIEAGESSRDAAIREVMEETGLVIHVGRLLWHVEEVSEERGQRFVNFFLGSVIGGHPEAGTDPELGDDEQVIEGLKFFTEIEVRELEHVYPDYMRNEVWEALLEENARDVYATRER
jgi:ADP-ribose pyrophosphatase YjhB (NUDIX family)